MPTPYYCGKTSVLIKRFTFHAVKVTFFVNTEVFGEKNRNLRECPFLLSSANI